MNEQPKRIERKKSNPLKHSPVDSSSFADEPLYHFDNGYLRSFLFFFLLCTLFFSFFVYVLILSMLFFGNTIKKHFFSIF